MAKIDDLIVRINELARKNKSPEGLTADEIEERDRLRKEYIAEFRKGFKHNILDNLYVMDKDGNKVKVQPKKAGHK